MSKYQTQMRLLGEASEKIQEAINTINSNFKLNADTIAEGKMYATQDLISAQIKVLMSLEDDRERIELKEQNDVDAWMEVVR